MTATGINVAALQGATGSFVSVKVTQVSQVSTANVKDSFRTRLDSASAGYGSQAKSEAIAEPETNKTEYSKEQVKANAAKEQKVNVSAPSDNDEYEVKDIKAQMSGTEETAVPPEEELTVKDAGITADIEEAAAGEIDAETLDRIMEIINTLIVQISNILETSMEELESKMNELQMIPEDLTDTDSIAKLILSLNGSSDISDMLVDNDMLDAFKDIRELIGKVLEDAGMTAGEFAQVNDSEEFREMLHAKGVTDEKHFIKPGFAKETAEEIEEAPEDIEEGFTVKVEKHGFEKSGSENSDEMSGQNEDSKTATVRETRASAKNEKPVQTNVSPAESFVKGLEDAMKVSGTELTGLEGRISARDIVYQLTEAVKVEISPENTRLEMSLNPESLGKVNLNITSKDGVMTAQITTQNEISKVALESQLQILKENIEAQGVRVEAIEVTVAAYTFADSKNAESEGYQEADGSGKRRTKGLSGIGNDLSAEEAEAERIRQEMMEQTGSTVTYVA
ncbi:MAG: flagellar hook-length control protein FliK [Lachnospiraceae bacterium]|nr:flagellar hook-length control protein FliK [Lachnospiraceae bacterium]